MAVILSREVYTNAMIDTDDMTLTEYRPDGIHTFNIMEILKRWDGVPDIEIEIRRRELLPENGR